MTLFDRDYRVLTEEEDDWARYSDSELTTDGGEVSKFSTIRFCDLPKVVRHNLQLFPNNWLDTEELKSKEILSPKVIHFKNLVKNPVCTERDLLNYIRQNNAYFMLGSLLTKYFRFGHHGAFLFTEFPLGNQYKADYLLVGLNSEGYHFVFVEFESPAGLVTKKDGFFGEVIRKGVEQVNSWEMWLDENFSYLRDYFERRISHRNQLPRDFYVYDKTRINFLVIAGQRSNYTEKTYRLRRKLYQDQNVTLLHYGNIIESSKYVIGLPGY